MFKLFRYLKNYKLQSIIGPVFKLIEVCFELAVPMVMANIIDIGIANGDKGYIFKMGGLLVLFGILGLVCALTAQYFAAKASLGFASALRSDLFRHINRFSYAEIDSIGSHTLVTRMTADINQTQTGVNLLLRLFLRSPFIVIGSIIMSFTVSVKLTAVFLIVVPCLAAVIYAVMHITVPKYKQVQKELDKTNLLTAETLTGARIIRAFSRQSDEENEFLENTESLNRKQIITGRISALLNPATYVIMNIAVIAIIWFGGKSVYSGSITQGEVIALVNYMSQILLALLMLALLITNITKMQASASRINDVFDIKPGITDGDKAAEESIPDASAVEFKNVSFSYPSSGENTLQNITLSASRGEMIGIIGGTGSGKTTLVNLIPRFYDCTDGEVLVDGVNVKEYTLDGLRRKIGVVPQKAVLFKGTVRENLKWRNENATDEEIESALEAAQAKDFVDATDEGLDHRIVQEGKNLSGGQRQRLTIARALVGDPEILILDDSASALDLATDARLRRAVSRISREKGTTVFIVSQRISSIKSADRIAVLDDGRLAGLGTHSELLNSCEVYKEICLSQLSGKELSEHEN